MGLWTFLHVPAHMITVGDFQSGWRKCNPIKKLKGQRGRYKAPLRARGFSRGFARCFGLRPTPKIPAGREKNLWYPGYVQLPSFGFSAGSTRNIIKLCVIYEESTLLSAILDSLLLRRKPHATARAQMTVISGHGIINIFKSLIDFG